MFVPIEGIVIYAIITTINVIDRLMVISGGYKKLQNALGYKRQILSASLKSIKEASLMELPELDELKEKIDDLDEIKDFFQELTFGFVKRTYTGL